jgi:integrase
MVTKNLTVAAIDAIKRPKSGQVEVFDECYPGLHIRVGPLRKTWSMYYRAGGKLHRKKLGLYPAMGLAAAREAWREKRGLVDAGLEPFPSSKAAAVAPAAPTFEEVFRDWLKRDQADNRSAKVTCQNIENRFLPLWKDRPFAEISRREIRDAIDQIVDAGVVTMARRSHTRLRRLFAWAVSRDIISTNPMTGLEAPGEEVERDRVLTNDELVQVWNGAGQLGYPLGSAYQLLILTGARRKEVGDLRWSEIEDDTIKLSGARTKNGKPHHIPLASQARALLASLPQVSDSVVFTFNGKTPITGWTLAKDRIDKLVKIEPWRLHDVRRTVATNLQKLGVNLQTTEAILGHIAGSRGGIVKVYQVHDFADEKRIALEAWGARVMALVEGHEPAKVLPLRGKR